MPESIPKSKGGRRPGAGRKPSTLKGVLKKLPSDTAELILQTINANQLWIDLAKVDDPNVRFKVLAYLTDRAYGKAQQAVDLKHSGIISSEPIDLGKLDTDTLHKLANAGLGSGRAM